MKPGPLISLLFLATLTLSSFMHDSSSEEESDENTKLQLSSKKRKLHTTNSPQKRSRLTSSWQEIINICNSTDCLKYCPNGDAVQLSVRTGISRHDLNVNHDTRVLQVALKCMAELARPVRLGIVQWRSILGQHIVPLAFNMKFGDVVLEYGNRFILVPVQPKNHPESEQICQEILHAFHGNL